MMPIPILQSGQSSDRSGGAMRTVALAFGSFMLGAFCAFLLLGGIHTPISGQLAFAQPPTFVQTDNKIPVVPQGIIELSKVSAGPAAMQQLDGIACKNFEFSARELKYGGGNFAFDHCTFNGVVTVELTGAAANTMALLQILSHLRRPSVPIPNPNTPSRSAQESHGRPGRCRRRTFS